MVNIYNLAPMQRSNEYIPGTCNIGRAEVKKRKASTWFSLILAIVVVLWIVFLNPAREWRLVLFIPVASLVVNFQQVYFGFCVNFGMRGVFNFDNAGKFDTIEHPEFRFKDKAKAIRMIQLGALTGAVAALIFYALPF
jgi:hypothetical protein